MQTTYKSNNSDVNLTEKINNFKKILKIQSFILLARPKDIVYESDVAKKKFFQDLINQKNRKTDWKKIL